MRKYLSMAFILGLALELISWGYVGHQTVARIAENHLTPQAKAAVKALLGNESLADVASWADEVRNDPQYKHTTPWHFLNLPLGLSHSEFDKTLADDDKENIYSALLKSENTLAEKGGSQEQKIEALKFIVHFVGDAHQPMHISRAEDKGGNTIQVQFDGRGTNLHSLWDSRLIDKQGLSYAEIAKQFDHATPAQIKTWQSDGPKEWMWESYQISTKLYAEVESNNKLTDDYYKAHVGIVDERLEQAGIRLAGMLNRVFANYKSSIKDQLTNRAQSLDITPSTEAYAVIQTDIKLENIGTYIERNVSVTGKVYGTRDMGSFVLVNLGGEYPNQLLTVLLRGETKSMAKDIEGKQIKVSGKVIDYKGKPEIVVTDKSKIVIIPLVGGSTHNAS